MLGQERYLNLLLAGIEGQLYDYRLLTNEEMEDKTFRAFLVVDAEGSPILRFELLTEFVDKAFSVDPIETFLNVESLQAPELAAELFYPLVTAPWSTVTRSHTWTSQALRRAFEMNRRISRMYFHRHFIQFVADRPPCLYLYFSRDSEVDLETKVLDADFSELTKRYPDLKKVEMEGFQLNLDGKGGYVLCEKIMGFVDGDTGVVLLPHSSSSSYPLPIHFENGIVSIDFQFKEMFKHYDVHDMDPLIFVKKFFKGLSADVRELRAIWTKDPDEPDSFSTIEAVLAPPVSRFPPSWAR